jgi:hypothetical protein
LVARPAWLPRGRLGVTDAPPMEARSQLLKIYHFYQLVFFTSLYPVAPIVLATEFIGNRV